MGTLGQILDRIPECPKQAQGFLDSKPGRMHSRWDQPNPGAIGVGELSHHNEHSGMSHTGIMCCGRWGEDEEGERRAISTDPSTGHASWDLVLSAGREVEAQPHFLLFCWGFPAGFAAGVGILGLGAFLGRWECGSLVAGAWPPQRSETPPLSWSFLHVCHGEQSCSSRILGQAGPCSRRDVLEGCSPGLVPTCPSVPPCKACSAPAKGENGPKPCGFLVGVNTGNPSFHRTFHWCLSVVQPFSNSLSISAAARVLFLRGAGQSRAGLSHQSLFHVWPDKSYREWWNFSPCCLNPTPIISISSSPLQMHQLLALGPDAPWFVHVTLRWHLSRHSPHVTHCASFPLLHRVSMTTGRGPSTGKMSPSRHIPCELVVLAVSPQGSLRGLPGDWQ